MISKIFRVVLKYFSTISGFISSFIFISLKWSRTFSLALYFNCFTLCHNYIVIIIVVTLSLSSYNKCVEQVCISYIYLIYFIKFIPTELSRKHIFITILINFKNNYILYNWKISKQFTYFNKCNNCNPN